MSSPAAGSRALHWVLKIGSLKKSMTFFENVLGLKVLRHEEFESGCEATCNGPYGGAWSKTMIGYGPEEEGFALELTYNYGIDSYKNGDDLQYISLQKDVVDTKAKAEAEGYTVVVAGADGLLISGPDGYKYKIVPPIEGRTERFMSVGLRVSDLSKSTAYWCDLNGMTNFPKAAPASEEEQAFPMATVGYSEEQVKLDLLQLPDVPVGTPVDHGLASGRIAFACDLVPPIHSAAAEATSGTVITPPLTLPTPGKADVVVTILGDPDGYEICYVEAEAFYQLAEPKYDVIDFASRATRGGDGAAPPKSEKLQHAAGVTTSVTTPEEVAEAVAQGEEGKSLVLLDFGAGWCKNCKKMVPAVERLGSGPLASKLKILTVDIEEAEDLADEYDVSAVPCFIALKGGSGDKAEEYKGSDPEVLEAKITALLE